LSFELFLFALLALVLGALAQRRIGRLERALSEVKARLTALEGGVPEAAAPSAAQPLPAALQPAPTPRKPKPEGPGLFARIEKSLTQRWFVWIGAALIVLAAFMIVRSAIEEGWFGPPAQLAMVYALGFALLAAAEWVRRRPELAGLANGRFIPPALAIGGLAAMFAATHAAIASFNLFSPPTAFVLFALVALAAILLSLRYGRWLMLFGLAAGYLAPVLVRFEHPAPEAVFAYILAMTVAAVAAIKLRGWRGLIWLVYAAALIWALAWLDTPRGQNGVGQAAIYLIGLCALAAAFSWNAARAAPPLRTLWRAPALRDEALAGAYGMALAAAFVLLAFVRQAHGPLTVAAVICFCALAVLAACLREGFSPAALIGGLLGPALIWTWPPPAMASDVAAMIRTAGALGFVFSAGGWLMMARSQRGGAGAFLAALGPIAVVFASHEGAGFIRPPLLWAAAALVLALLDAFALERIGKRLGGVDRAPDATAAFALGAAAGAFCAVQFALEGAGLWLSMTLSLLVPVMAALDRRFSLGALRIAIGIVAFVVVWRLTLGLDPVRHTISVTPVFNEILPGYVVPIFALGLAAWMYRKAGNAPRLAGGLEGGALALFAVGAFWEARHLFGGGRLLPGSGSIAEVGVMAAAWIGMAAVMAPRFGPHPSPTRRIGETTLAALGAFLALAVNGLMLNPWWGEAPGPTPGWPVFNLLLVGFGLPALTLAAYAIAKRRQGFGGRAALAGAAATGLVFLNVTLEVRRWFHPDATHSGVMAPAETWAYTAAWIVLAAALLGLGLLRRKPTLRYASLAVLLAAIIKAFGFDMSALTGVLRALSYFALGAAVIATALIYQRFVFPRVAKPADPDPRAAA
jgi:uncharacterized membrane protein